MTSPARICFQLQIAPELLAEHIERHTPVWPEMLAEIAASGRQNYSLFLAEGGRLIGYYETDDDAAAQAYLAASPSRRGGKPRWAGSSSASAAAPTRPPLP
jgi:L-rhamnose mutarotase